jgi:hypothetical protein
VKILAYDPGGTTGYCGWHDEHGVTMQDQIDTPDHHLILEALLNLVDPDVVVYETFNYIPDLADADLIAREYIGVIKLWGEKNTHAELVPQSPNYGKAFWDNDKLKKAGLYKPGLPHANDATRHMLAYVSFHLSDTQYLHMLKEA